MGREFRIRTAAPADEAQVSALLAASYGCLMAPCYEASAFAVALPLLSRANPALLSSGTFYLAESDGGRLVGCGGWTAARPGTGEVVSGLAHIRHFGTHPDWIGRGIGRALYDRCAAVARAAGARRFECNAGLNAEAFYGALGFTTLCRIDNAFTEDISLPAVLMARDI